MILLALEFSAPRRSVALLQCAPESGAVQVLGCLSDDGRQSVRPLLLIERLLRLAGRSREKIALIAIGLGPGSYTGIRSAIALAQGWQLARQVKLTGSGSVDCLAFQAQSQGVSGLVDIVIDAQRNEFYLARFAVCPERREIVEPLRLATLEEVRGRAEKGDAILIGPEVARWFPSGQVLMPDAAALGRLALERADFLPGEKLEPIYLRETRFVKAPPPRIFPI